MVVFSLEELPVDPNLVDGLVGGGHDEVSHSFSVYFRCTVVSVEGGVLNPLVQVPTTIEVRPHLVNGQILFVIGIPLVITIC